MVNSPIVTDAPGKVKSIADGIKPRDEGWGMSKEGDR
jgi:hypothetical protein